MSKIDDLIAQAALASTNRVSLVSKLADALVSEHTARLAAEASRDEFQQRFENQMDVAVDLLDQNAALHAVIREVDRLARLDLKCPCCSGYGHILEALAAVPGNPETTDTETQQ